MKEIIVAALTAYILIISIIGFFMMGMDKRRAIKKAWRIPERTLLLTALIGGGIGSMLGMYVFRHKTKHIRFVVLLPLSAVLVVAFLLYLYQII